MTPAEINALPERVRRYIMWLETDCDPQGTIRENFRLREENAGLRQECGNQAAEIERLLAAMKEACDLLAERTYGSPARSPGHNARLRLESAMGLNQQKTQVET